MKKLNKRCLARKLVSRRTNKGYHHCFLQKGHKGSHHCRLGCGTMWTDEESITAKMWLSFQAKLRTRRSNNDVKPEQQETK